MNKQLKVSHLQNTQNQELSITMLLLFCCRSTIDTYTSCTHITISDNAQFVLALIDFTVFVGSISFGYKKLSILSLRTQIVGAVERLHSTGVSIDGTGTARYRIQSWKRLRWRIDSDAKPVIMERRQFDLWSFISCCRLNIFRGEMLTCDS